MKRLWIVIVAVLSMVPGLRGEVLFDFERSAESWRVLAGHYTKAEPSPDFATSGGYSLLFETRAFDGNMPRWPSISPAELPINDWSGYEKLTFDLVNPTPYQERVGIIVSDPEGGNFGGFYNHCGLFIPPYSHHREIIHLPSIPSRIDRTKIRIQIFTEGPEHDYQLYIDNFQLLKLGEEPAPLPASFSNRVVAMRQRLLAGVEGELAAARATLNAGDYPPELRAVGEAAFAALEERVLAAKARAADTALELDARSQAISDALGVAEQTVRLNELLRWLGAAPASEGVLAGFVLPERRVFPRDLAIGAVPARQAWISAARNEREGVALVLAPVLADLTNVRVALSPFVRQDGQARFEGSVAPVGYVKIKAPGVLGTPYLGWWPDPVLTYLDAVDVARFDYQSWHIAVDVAEDQPAGHYTATATVTADGVAPIELPVEFLVRDFAIPKHTPLPLAFSTTYPRNCWNRILTADTPEDKAGREAFDDFLMRYNLTLDHIYRDAPPVYAEQERERELGKLVQALAWTFYGPPAPEHQAQFIDNLVDRIRPVYEELKRRDLLDYAYIYGLDEIVGAEALLGALAERLHREFPGVPVMTTAKDATFGNASPAAGIDIWVPPTGEYDLEQARKLRARGKQMWYYVCMGPALPYANFMLDNNLTGARGLTGFQAAVSRTDGLLYYETTMWKENPDLSGGPFLEHWETATTTAMHHSDGSIFYPGPGGLPVPSLRLEAIRNGLDDYAYYAILKAQYRLLKNDPARADWTAKAARLLSIPPEVAVSLTEYAQAPEPVNAYRNALGDAIEAAGVAVNPWGDHFTIRTGAVLNLPEMQ